MYCQNHKQPLSEQQQRNIQEENADYQEYLKKMLTEQHGEEGGAAAYDRYLKEQARTLPSSYEDAAMLSAVGLVVNNIVEETEYAKLQKEIDRMNDEIRDINNRNEFEKKKHQSFVQQMNKECHAMAFTLSTRRLNRLLHIHNLGDYIPSKILDVNILELRQEAEKEEKALQEIRQMIKNFPFQKKELLERESFYTELYNRIWCEGNYDVFKESFPPEPETCKVFGGLADFKIAMEAYAPPPPPPEDEHGYDTSGFASLSSGPHEDEKVKYPRLPKAKGFKPFNPKKEKKSSKDSEEDVDQ